MLGRSVARRDPYPAAVFDLPTVNTPAQEIDLRPLKQTKLRVSLTGLQCEDKRGKNPPRPIRRGPGVAPERTGAHAGIVEVLERMKAGAPSRKGWQGARRALEAVKAGDRAALEDLIEIIENSATIADGWDELTPLLYLRQKLVAVESRRLKELWDSIPPYQRKARTKGIPVLGAGLIYPVDEEDIKVRDFPIPDHWLRGSRPRRPERHSSDAYKAVGPQ